jgi:hypothetical protein
LGQEKAKKNTVFAVSRTRKSKEKKDHICAVLGKRKGKYHIFADLGKKNK